MTLAITLAIQGRLGPFLEAERRLVLRRGNKVTRAATRRLKDKARTEARRGLGARRRATGRGRKFENAIRGDIFDNRDGSVTGFVYSKFGRKEGGEFLDYLATFEKARTLRPRRGRFLVIPVKGASRRVDRIRRAFENLGKDPKLALIPQRGGRFLFVRRTSRRRTTLIAVLIRRARVKKLLDFDRVEREAEARFFRDLAAELARP